jgi:hypothetical protein
VVIVDEAFVLTTTIVEPGTVLTDPIVVNKEIFAAFGDSAVLGASTWGGKPGAAWAETDFFHTLGFSAITAPEGVTWTSASGEFLNQSPIPVPETAWLFVSALFVLTLLRLRGETRGKITWSASQVYAQHCGQAGLAYRGLRPLAASPLP